MTTYTLWLDSTTATSSAAVVGPFGPSAGFDADDDTTATNGAVIDADTTDGAFTITLPEDGGTVTIRDMAASWEGNALTVDGNGATIDGGDTFEAWPGYAMTFTRRSADTEWRFTGNYLYGAG